jgi:hypothetical protein
MRFKRKDFTNLNRIKALFLLAIIILLISGCAGTFRTADVLNKGEKTMTVSLPLANLTNLNSFIINPDLSYRWGIGYRMDLGIKAYLLGAEFSACRNILKEGKFNPAIALQLSTGVAVFDGIIGESALLFSKKIGVYSLYSGIRYKLLTNTYLVRGFYRKILYTGGIQLSANKENKIYIEVYNTPIPDDVLGEHPHLLENVLIGLGFRCKIGH